jgi:hypothetical protein
MDIPNAPRYGKVTVVLRPPTSHRKPFTELIVLYKGGSQTFTVPRSQPLWPHHHRLPPRLPSEATQSAGSHDSPLF